MHTSCRLLIAIITALATLLWANVSHALTPESGWWWNEAESGRGFSIELQNNTIFMSGFLYDTSGAPLWFVASGPYSQTANSFEGDMLSLRGGQCISCSYRPAIIQPSLGRIQLRFDSPSTASMTWPGGNLAIKRQIFGVASDIEKLFGTFAFSSAGNSNRVHFGNWLTFSQTINDANLGKVAVGATEGGRTVVAAFNAERTSILVLVDASTNYYESYLIPVSFFGSREGSGLWATYLKTQTPPLPSAYAHMARIFAASATPAAAPTSSPKAQASADQSAETTTRLHAELNADAFRQLESKFSAVAKQSNPDAAVFALLATLIKAAH